MKKWLKPEVQNLALGDTKTDGCPYLGEDGIVAFTPIPNGPLGVEHCPKWDGTGCTHKNYGGGNPKNWPCPKSTTGGSGSTEGLMS